MATIVKCSACENEFELPAESKKCQNCGYRVSKTVDKRVRLLKKTKKEALALTKIFDAKLKSNCVETHFELRAIAKSCRKVLVLLPASNNDDRAALLAKTNEQLDLAYQDSINRDHAVVDSYIEKAKLIAIKVDIEPPTIESIEKSLLKLHSIRHKEVVDIKEKLKNGTGSEKEKSVADILMPTPIRYFFALLTAMLGMITAENINPVMGVSLIISAIMIFPAVSKIIVTKYTWVNQTNLFFVALAVFVGCLVQLYYFLL